MRDKYRHKYIYVSVDIFDRLTEALDPEDRFTEEMGSESLVFVVPSGNKIILRPKLEEEHGEKG